MASKFYSDPHASHLRSISQGDGGFSIVGSRGKKVNNDGWNVTDWSNNKGFSTSVDTWVQGKAAVLAVREVSWAESFSAKFQQMLSIIIAEENGVELLYLSTNQLYSVLWVTRIQCGDPRSQDRGRGCQGGLPS